MSDNRIPLSGVIGAPIAHSKSPRLHGHWLARYGISGHYIPMHVAPSDLSTALITLPKLGFVGANVTIPHKVSVLDHIDTLSLTAKAIGAANTLVFHRDGSISGDNTDAYGFMANLRQQAPNWKASDGPVLILGAGGAARAIVYAMLDSGAKEVWVSNRTGAKVQGLQQSFEEITPVDWFEVEAAFGQAATVVNTTSLGMDGGPEFKLGTEALRAGTTVADIVYAPLETPLLRAAKARDCVTVEGLGMLLHQGVPGFERWFGLRPDVTQDTYAAVMG